MKTLKPFSIEAGNWGEVIVDVWTEKTIQTSSNWKNFTHEYVSETFKTIEEAYNWLQEKGYITDYDPRTNSSAVV